MHVGVLGINFKTAELSLHEAVARAAFSIFQEKQKLFPYPAILLSTCNRTEIYYSSENLVLAGQELSLLLKAFTEKPLNDCLYSYFGRDCFAHLCKVSSGLDSAIFMETEIIRQVRAAYLGACQSAGLSKHLHFVFQKAFKIAKGVRTHFVKQKGGAAFFHTLWQIAKKEFTDLPKRRILLVGYSETHRRFAHFLWNRGILDFAFCTRYPENVLEAKAFDRGHLQNWTDYDLISCASQTDHFLIRGEGKKKHLIFDLSVPRNVDPEVKGAVLWNIEQINRLFEETKGFDQTLLEESEGFLLQNVARLSEKMGGALIKSRRGPDIGETG